MSGARIGILVLAILAAALAAFLVNSMISESPAPVTVERQPEVEMAQVLVASQNLNSGQTLKAGQLRWQSWPKDAVGEHYIVRGQRPDAISEATGAVVRFPITSGEPVTDAKIVHFENASFMAGALRPGMRAVSTSISPETGAGGFILPNDRVDVILTRQMDAEGGERSYVSETIIANVRVLAVDQTFREVGDQQVVIGKTATLELPPKHAEVLALAQAMGEISLTLRSLADATENGLEGPQLTATLDGRLPEEPGGGVSVIRYGTPVRVAPSLGR